MSIGDASVSEASVIQKLNVPRPNIAVINHTMKSRDKSQRADKLFKEYATPKNSGKVPGHYNLI